MKKSIIISLQKVISKAVSLLLIASFLFGSIYYDLPKKLFSKMASNALSSREMPVKQQLKSLFTFEFPQTVLAAMPLPPQEEPTLQTKISATPLPQATPSAEPFPVTKDVSAQTAKNKPTSISIKNHTGKTFSTEELLQKELPYQKDSGGYKVLVVHTHTTESYFPTDRSNDETQNMIQVGKEFTAVLEQNGIKTLHITKVHDVPYATSYKKSLESINNALAEHPSIEVVIDLHRDALYNAANEKIKPLTTINGINAAQVMIVTGTDEGGLPHPNWKENLSFAIKIQNDFQKSFPGLSRPLDFRKERFNTHTTKNSIILEIGSNGNTIEEAISGAKFAAQSVANVLLGS